MVMSYVQGVGQSLFGGGKRDLNADSGQQEFTATPVKYDLLEGYYDGTLYLDQALRRQMPGLPDGIRLIYNPTTRAVDWWPAHVYPGVWSEDGLPVSGRSNRIPYASDMPEPLRLAVQQAFSWGNWGSDVRTYVLTGAMLGEVFVEIENNLDRRKVYPRLIHPRYVKDIEWNATGDVTMYELEIPQKDASGSSYKWGKRVTKETITTLRDGQPAAYDGNDAEQPNPWGFVPAVWVQHRNIGGQHGAPAIHGLIHKINEANGLASKIDDYIMRFTEQYVIVGTDDPTAFMERVNGANSAAKSASDASFLGGVRDWTRRQTDRRQSIPVAAAKGSVSGLRLYENMGLADSDPHVARLLSEIEDDLPEITLSQRLQEMTQVTAPGAVPLVQDVQHKLDESAGNYDAGIVKIGQMCVSIAAKNIEVGAWPQAELSDAQRRFLPFSSESYANGELAHALTPRELVPVSPDQRISRAGALEGLSTVKALVFTGEMDEEAAQAWIDERNSAMDAAEARSARRFAAGLGGL